MVLRVIDALEWLGFEFIYLSFGSISNADQRRCPHSIESSQPVQWEGMPLDVQIADQIRAMGSLLVAVLIA
jgi:hypothetical protein